MNFTGSYSHHFTRQGMNSIGHARHYVGGLLGTGRRKNIETIGQDVRDADYQGLEQFISKSPWDHEALLDQVGWDADGLLGGHPDSALYLDETAFSKKGRGSVGVKTQYNGRLGHKDNCQVGVFACLGRGNRVALVDMSLFLPADWAADPARLDKAGVPAEHRRHRTKLELALEQVGRARQRGLRYGWVGFDALYGRSHAFTEALEQAGERFVGDVDGATKVWTAPPGEEGACRLTVNELCEEEFAAESRRLTFRAGTKGQLRVQAWVRRVWLHSQEFPELRERWLIVSQDAAGDWKYSLSNCLEINDPVRLVYMQHQRYFIEHAFHEAKDQLGMAQYQVRKWRGWHHHMALVCLAMLFCTKEQILQAESVPLLSLANITTLLDYYLPRNHHSEVSLLRTIQASHRQRQRDIDNRRRRQQRLDQLYN